MTLCPFQFYNRIHEEKRAGCFAFIVFRISCFCKCVVALLHGTVRWSAVCDCIMPLSYSFLFWLNAVVMDVQQCTRFVPYSQY